MKKIGRNEQCPCGSAKKFKKCCLIKTTTPLRPISPIPLEILQKLAVMQEQARKHQSEFGKIREPIGVQDCNGYQTLVVGSRLLYSNKKWSVFPDILFDYMPAVLGREWCKTESEKSVISDRHPILQFLARHAKSSELINPANPALVAADGSMSAYLHLAYDLFVIEDNGRLDEELIRRLKIPDQFQGARHELFAEAICLRAGFEIQHEDEKDPNSRHAEFTAIHKTTKQKISVEAKSKHRGGVLGQPGDRQPDEMIRLRYGTLLRDAIAKKPPYPLAVFVDTNLPPLVASKFFEPVPADASGKRRPPEIANKMLNEIRKEHGGKDPFALIVFSNHPHHFVNPGEVDPESNTMSVLPEQPLMPILSPGALLDLHLAASKSKIPTKLPR